MPPTLQLSTFPLDEALVFLSKTGLLEKQSFQDFLPNNDMHKTYQAKFGQDSTPLAAGYHHYYLVQFIQEPVGPPDLIDSYQKMNSKFINSPFDNYIKALPYTIRRARLSWLEPKSQIDWHSDHYIENTYFNVHIPLLTNQGNFIEIKRHDKIERFHYQTAGEPSYFDISIPHRVENVGTKPRVHFIFCVII